MKAQRRPPQRRDSVAPIFGQPWVEVALGSPGVILGDVAKSVADAAVFAAIEAIAEQGVQGEPEFWEIDALHRLVTEIVVLRLQRGSNRVRAVVAPAVAGRSVDADDAKHENDAGYVTRLMLTDEESPR